MYVSYYRKIKKIAIFIFAVFLFFGIVFISNNSSAETATAPSGVTVEGIDVSGMTEAEVEEVIQQYVASYENATFTLQAGSKSITASATDLGLSSRNKNLASQVVSFGKSGNPLERYRNKKELASSGKDFSISLSADREVLTAYLESRSGELTVEAKNYSLKRVDGEFQITDGQDGVTVPIERAVSQISNYMNTDWAGGDAVLELATEIVEPTGNKETLSQVTDLLGTYTTDYSPANTARGTNVERAAELMNGTILYPGETASVYATISPMTADNGYEAAGAYVNGTVVQEEGGGVCQVSSTAYNAILAAELEIETRAAHSMIIHYVGLSMDAAIAGESDGSSYLKDLQFTNNKDYPVFLEFITSDGELTVNVWGKETRPENREVTYETEVTGVTPYTVSFVADPTQPVGVVKRASSGSTGYQAKLWKIVTVDGVEESRTKQNQSSYNMSPASYVVGTFSSDAAASEAVSAAVLSQDPATIYSVVFQYSGVAPSIATDSEGNAALLKLMQGGATTESTTESTTEGAVTEGTTDVTVTDGI